MYRQPHAQRQRQLVLPNPDQIGTMIVRGATNFARRNKVITGSYLIGLLLIVFVGSGTQLTVQQAREYNRIMNTIDLQAEFDASQEYYRARNAYHATKGWFSCDYLCQRNRDRMMDAERTLKAIRKEGEARMSDAKKVAGLFSEVGVGEVKDSFWQYFHSGKEFAKRQTMWDSLFIGIRQMSRGRDESWIEFGLKILMQLLLNFSLGLVMALLFFIFGLWTIVRSYQPNPLVAVVFFVGASLAAMSFVASFLMGLYGAAAGGVYAVLKVAETSANARLQDQQRRERVGYNRPHYQ